MIVKLCMVALGGAVGALARYLISLLPYHGGFPLLTLATNLIGALVIGIVVGLSDDMSENGTLFLKTGICGGFTTFSTFSLETLTLLESGRTGLGVLYAAASLLLCVCGVWAGKSLCRLFCG